MRIAPTIAVANIPDIIINAQQTNQTIACEQGRRLVNSILELAVSSIQNTTA
jgi:hypothetical protein